MPMNGRTEVATIDVYSKIHKGQRAWMSDLLVRAGRVGDDDAIASEALLREQGLLLAHLRAHAEHEERYIHPVLREASPDIAERLERQHRELDRAFANAEDPGVRAGSRYRALADLIAAYFVHLATEEQEALPLLMRFADDELIERILRPFAGSRSPEDVFADLALQLVAVTPAEGRLLLAAATVP
jgi:hypothetical protein